MRNELPDNRNLNRDDSLESALAMLQPAPSRIDRDKIMYAAGQSAATTAQPARRRWLWPTMTVLSLCVAVTSLGMYASAKNRPPTTRVVYVNRRTPAAPVGDTRRDVVAPKPNNRQQPVDNNRNQPQVESDPTWTVSNTTRARFPALLTNADHLPDTANGGSRGSRDSNTYAAMRKRYTRRSTQKRIGVGQLKSKLFFWQR